MNEWMLFLMNSIEVMIVQIIPLSYPLVMINSLLFKPWPEKELVTFPYSYVSFQVWEDGNIMGITHIITNTSGNMNCLLVITVCLLWL